MATILIIEDDPLNQRLLTLMLERENHSIITANDGQDALRCLQEAKVDLVITDFSMPNMDGVTLVKRLRADAQYRHLPIIVLTAIDWVQQRFEKKEEGADLFLTKPTSSRELKAAVSRYVT